MVFEFEGAHGVRHLLDRIRLAVRVVVHGIDAPLGAGAVMLGVQNAVHDRVAHVEVGRRHIDLGAQHTRAIGEFSFAHTLEEVEVLVDGAVAIRALIAGLGERTAMLANLVGAQIVDIGFAVSY